MGRVAKHNWRKLFLEYNQGRYKNVAEFAEKKGLHPVAVRREFGKLKKESEDQPETQQNATEKRNKTQQKKEQKSETKQKDLHAWEKIKQQFTDWPDDKLKAYLKQLELRKEELESIPPEEVTPEEYKELGKVRRERRAILSDPDSSQTCSGHNRDGSQCKNPVERGKRVCWMHGGAPGAGGQKGNQNAVKHGFFAKIFPDDEETREIYEAINTKSPMDILWDQIVIQYTAIARAQKIMFVRNQEDITKHLKHVKGSNLGKVSKNGESIEVINEREWEFQYAWDKHASFLKAQSAAIKTIDGLILRYEDMVDRHELKGLVVEEHRLRVEKLKADVAKAQGGGGELGDILDEVLEEEGLTDG